MKISCIQMNMKLGDPEYNFSHAEELICWAAFGRPDVIVLPETWNTGFFPKEELAAMADENAADTILHIGALAGKYRVNIVAGSVANRKDGRIYNTSCIFDRQGNCIASYDKVHLFSPMGEDQAFTPGNKICQFTIDGIRCGLVICYDLRFPEWVRKTVLPDTELLFVVSQWPDSRLFHLKTLTAARAIENQCFTVCCNSCGTAYETTYGGHSMILDPLGETLAAAEAGEIILTADCDLSETAQIRRTIPVFHDRRPELYDASDRGTECRCPELYRVSDCRAECRHPELYRASHCGTECDSRIRSEKETLECRPRVAVSACLLGENCKYNGGNNYRVQLQDLLADYEVIPVCPEVSGGLPTPRTPVELRNGIPFDRNGICREKEFRLGTKRTMQQICERPIAFAILQSRSPSCGVNQIYDGTFTGTKIPGMGMFAAALKAAGYPVYDVEEVLAKWGKSE